MPILLHGLLHGKITPFLPMHVTNFDEDLIELRDFSKRLLQFIEVEHLFVEGSLVVGLSSKYGSGKSTFFRMWKDDLEKADSPVTVVSLNAWESDYIGDPLFSIVAALVGRIQKSGQDPNAIVSAAKDLGWLATAVGGQLVAKFTGVDMIAAGDVAEKKKAERETLLTVPMDAFSVYQQRESAMARLKAALGKFIEESEARILFLVDELDRCRPDFAIAYLETIKHIFDLPGATFVLAADRHHLENSARTAFGPNLDFDEYYRKFVHREVTLPPISKAAYHRFATKYAKHFLERDDVRQCFIATQGNSIENLAKLIASLNLTPRQIQECFRILGHLLSTKPENRGRLLWCLGAASIAMAAFRIGKPDVFHNLGTQSLSPNDAIKLLRDDLKLDHVDWWFTLFATGGGIALPEGQKFIDVMKAAGFVSEDAESMPQHFGQWSQGWGHSHESRIAQTYQRIEQIMQW
jgi:hypothetical protein